VARPRSGSGTLIRELNRSAILAFIWQRGPIARVEIARALALSPATVTVLTRDLVREGVVREVAQAPSTGGRPAILLGLVADAAHALGVKISPHRLTAVRVSLDGEPVQLADRPFDASAPDAVDRLIDELAQLASSGGGQSRLLGIGLGVPGTVDPRRGGTVESPILGWRAVPLAAQVQERLQLPVLVDNDVNTLAVSERLYGRGRAAEHSITVTIGIGVGLGIIIGGEIYRGGFGGAGEFGHVRVVEDGPSCYCGGRGCLETLVSDAALTAAGRDGGILGQGDGVDRLRDLADTGNVAAREIYARAGRTLGRAVAGLVNVLSPQLVLVSGEGTQAWPHLEDAFREALRADTFAPLAGVPVEMDPWDDAKWARGAAALVLRATFSPPLYEHQPDDAVRARLTMVEGAA
jgi:predicted NBD/HSP70 family sugar kinase